MEYCRAVLLLASRVTFVRSWYSTPSACCVPRFEEGGPRGFKGVEGGFRDALEMYTCVLTKAV